MKRTVLEKYSTGITKKELTKYVEMLQPNTNECLFVLLPDWKEMSQIKVFPFIPCRAIQPTKSQEFLNNLARIFAQFCMKHILHLTVNDGKY